MSVIKTDVSYYFRFPITTDPGLRNIIDPKPIQGTILTIQRLDKWLGVAINEIQCCPLITNNIATRE